ncbi:MAG TPA: hypothetical protein VHF89_17030 [Solirubrobacteraceae bacterium]|nr:hypothetical protein [Solirubrobacteraceae bacterium]
MSDPEAVYSALAAVVAIVAAVETAVLLSLDARARRLAAEKGTNRLAAAYDESRNEAGRATKPALAILGGVLLLNAATVVPLGSVTICELDADWRFLVPWLAVTLCAAALVGWAAWIWRSLRATARDG